MYELFPEEINISDSAKVKEVEDFLKKHNLEYEKDVDCTIVIKRHEDIVATCSKSKNILKCFAVDEGIRGEGVSSKLVTWMNNKLFDQGIFHSFIFTKPKNEEIFKGIGYKVVEKTEKIVLLENGISSIQKQMKKIKEKYNIGDAKKSALVMNCNPFTLGHKYLIERAAAESEEVLVFIVQEEKSLFPFKTRLKLVQEGTKELKNVKVIPGGDYIISSATFPNYFLRKNDDKLEIFTELDASIFGKHFCKYFNIKKRYVGEEPYCEVTKSYNDTLKRTLETYGVQLIEIKRKEEKGEAISASRVRRLIKDGEWEQISEIVPETTDQFIQGNEGKEIVEKVKLSDSPH